MRSFYVNVPSARLHLGARRNVIVTSTLLSAMIMGGLWRRSSALNKDCESDDDCFDFNVGCDLTTGKCVDLNDRCYELDVASGWGLSTYPIKPVTGWPAQHSYVTRGSCNTQFQAGDPLPSNTDPSCGCQNPMQPGDVCPAGAESSYGIFEGWASSRICMPNLVNGCHSRPASTGEMFFAYNVPNSWSSNVGFEVVDALMLYFVVDRKGSQSLVFCFDKAGNPDGGRIAFTVSAPQLPRTNMIQMRDDHHEPTDGEGGPTYYWPLDGSDAGPMFWKWAPCCTDGLVLGPMPLPDIGNLEFSLKFNGEGNFVKGQNNDGSPGLTRFMLANYDKDNAGISFTELDFDTVINGAVTVRLRSCSSHCTSKTNCGSCSQDASCLWCESEQRCLWSEQDDITCPGTLYRSDDCCPGCSQHNSSATCLNELGCAWDWIGCECLSGVSVGGEDLLCAEATPDANGKAMITYAGATDISTCPGYSTCNHMCSGSGACDWQRKQCTCDCGFGGEGCESECPGGCLNTCSGKGICNVDTGGQCFCDCGFSGSACEFSGCGCTDKHCFNSDCTKVCGLVYNTTNSQTNETTQSCTGAPGAGSLAHLCMCLNGYCGKDPETVCFEKYVGECTDCTQICPGGPDPATTCGGYGTCNQDTCGCVCDACFEVDPNNGTCVEQQDLACPPQRSIQISPPQCWPPPKNPVTFPLWDPVNWNGGKQCVCKGYWTGTLCDICSCPGGVPCNDVTGSCEYTLPCDPDDPSTLWNTNPANATEPAWWFSLKSPWVLIFRQTSPFLWPACVDGKVDGCTLDMGADEDANFAVLNNFERLRHIDGKFELKLTWPGTVGNSPNEWQQSTNPFLNTEDVFPSEPNSRFRVDDYEAFSIGHDENRWGGIVWDGQEALLKGSVGHCSAYYLVGANQLDDETGTGYKAWADTPPAPVIELYSRDPLWLEMDTYCTNYTEIRRYGNWTGWPESHRSDINASDVRFPNTDHVNTVAACQDLCTAEPRCVGLGFGPHCVLYMDECIQAGYRTAWYTPWTHHLFKNPCQFGGSNNNYYCELLKATGGAA